MADIFRHRGPAWRASHAGHVSLDQLKVMSALERCRTWAFSPRARPVGALGGHVERCEACAHLRISYSGDVNIAYQVIGTGPFDLVWIPPGASNVELQWEFPEYARFVTRLASFCRVIVFDKRGTGLSDRGFGIASLNSGSTMCAR